MEENVDQEIYDAENLIWKEQVLVVGRNFCIVYGALALVRDMTRFICGRRS